MPVVMCFSSFKFQIREKSGTVKCHMECLERDSPHCKMFLRLQIKEKVPLFLFYKYRHQEMKRSASVIHGKIIIDFSGCSISPIAV